MTLLADWHVCPNVSWAFHLEQWQNSCPPLGTQGIIGTLKCTWANPMRCILSSSSRISQLQLRSVVCRVRDLRPNLNDTNISCCWKVSILISLNINDGQYQYHTVHMHSVLLSHHLQAWSVWAFPGMGGAWKQICRRTTSRLQRLLITPNLLSL